MTSSDFCFFFFSSRRRHTRCGRDWSSDVCSSDLHGVHQRQRNAARARELEHVDRSVGMLELARSRGVPLALMDAMDVSLRPETFDVAAMIFMLFHLDDPVAALRNVRRVLRPGGTLGVVAWAEDPDVEATRLWQAELDALGAREPDPIPRKHELMNTTEKMAGLLSAAGFHPQRLWVERLEHQWTVEGLMALHTRFGRARRKLDSLDP